MRYKNLSKCLSLLAIGILIILLVCYNLQKAETCTKNVFALNTYASVTVTGKDAETFAEEAIQTITDAEKVFSAHHMDSELYQLNTKHQTGVPFLVSKELFSVLQKAIQLCENTNGKFDITIKPILDIWSITENPRVPAKEEIHSALPMVDYRKIELNATEQTITFLKDGMQIDLGGIAKGYIADRLATQLAPAQSAIIDLGGNVIVTGQRRGGWKIGIQTPFAQAGMQTAIIKVPSDKTTTVVTSGAYERNFEKDGILYHHIIDPYTGYPYQGEIESVSVIGTSSMTADAYATYLFMLLPEEAIRIAKKEGFDILIQTKDKVIYTTLTDFDITDQTYKIK